MSKMKPLTPVQIQVLKAFDAKNATELVAFMRPWPTRSIRLLKSIGYLDEFSYTTDEGRQAVAEATGADT